MSSTVYLKNGLTINRLALTIQEWDDARRRDDDVIVVAQEPIAGYDAVGEAALLVSEIVAVAENAES